ncbi:AAA family ATPase [Alkalibacillus aidingensis]|uniref:AAA family ATPase n=1 Tax=Alkalibacillus aidingensis TaxID=2747607 RepID=UPI0016602E60|nr:SMC family ATPase [Alkalibacillus aidingensis]
MKPMKLTLTAFGPYKDYEVIEFDKLQNHRLFVVSGKTGAGKTTIFDGISFALYGSASGEDRENKQMLRSDFAKDEVHTSVDLIFELHGETYRIFRQLGHVKQGNKTPTGDKVEFMKVVGEREEPCVDRQMRTVVDDKVKELVGLTHSQFSQIVMLPQGEFRKLLTSNTENKEAILRKIFKTEPYQQINEKLKEKREEARSNSQKLIQKRDHLINEVSAKLPRREGSNLFEVLDQDNFNVNQLMNGITNEQSYYKQYITDVSAKKEELNQRQKKLTDYYHQAKVVHDKFKELEGKENHLEMLAKREAEFQEKEKVLKLAELASHLIPHERQLIEIKEELQSKEEHVKNLSNQLNDRKNILEKAEALYQEEKGREESRQEVRDYIYKLNELLPRVKELTIKENEVKELREKTQQLQATVNQFKESCQHIEEKKEKQKKEINQLEQVVATYQTKYQQLMTERDKAKAIKDYIDQLKKQTKLMNQLQEQKKEFLEAQQLYENLEESWVHSQAGVLAQHLHDGHPCPVCGSKEHPDKQSTISQAPSKELMEEKKSQMNTLQETYLKTESQLETVQQEINQSKEAVQVDHDSLEDLEAQYEEICEKGKKLRQEVTDLEQKQQKLLQLKEESHKLEEQLKKQQQHKDQAEQEYQQQQSNYQKSEGAYQELLNSIPENARSLEFIEQKSKEMHERKQALERKWEQAQKNYEEAKQRVIESESNYKNTVHLVNELKAKREKHEKYFNEELKKATFETEESYQQAKRSEEEINKLKAEIDDYHQTVKALQNRIGELNEELKDKEKVDLTTLETQINEVMKKYEEVLNEYNVIKRRIEDIDQLKGQISEAHKAAEEVEKQLSRINDLYDIVRGQNSRKISFERYLQIEYLEQIIEAANERLRVLSNGQFYLERSDRQESQGKQSGLGLDVYDAYTGQARDVKSLSGGEKFNASLCLALGMSDVIQSFQGGVSIETMFIDEGFGSLDEESLNKAIDTLIDLQKSGRMIGVISHVQELKSAIPAILEVRKNKDGYSETEFIIS